MKNYTITFTENQLDNLLNCLKGQIKHLTPLSYSPEIRAYNVDLISLTNTIETQASEKTE